MTGTVSTPYDATATISSTEYSLYANSTSLAAATDNGSFSVFLNVKNMTATEAYQVTFYETVNTKEVFHSYILYGVQPSNIHVTPMFPLCAGWDITVKKLQGTDRAFSWSIRKLG